MKEIFTNQTNLNSKEIYRSIFLIIIFPPLLVLFSKIRKGGKHAMGVTGYCVSTVLVTAAVCIMLLTDKTIRKILIDEDSKKLIIIMQKRFRKPFRIQITADGLEIKEKSFTNRGDKKKTIVLQKGTNSFTITNEFKGVSFDDMESISTALKMYYPVQKLTNP